MIRAPVRRPLLAISLAALVSSCDEPALQVPADAGEPVLGLSAEQSARVLAKVGERVITLGDFGRTLERMDQFDRLRYQTKERRRELLSEIIDAELLALEAKRRGLDKEAAVEDAIRQILREAMIAQARKGLPAPADIPASEVRAYYEANADKFSEPERRRVSAIVVGDRALGEKVLKEAQKAASSSAWGELFLKHSQSAPKDKSKAPPLDLAGELGIVSPPGDPRGAHPQVPEPVRAAVFRIASVGAVSDELVEADGRFYIVRLSGLTGGHRRALAEAERSIRVALLQQKMQEQERALEDELRKKFPVEINDAALSSVKLPQQLTQPGGATPPDPAKPSAPQPEQAGGAAPSSSDAGK
ncbi:peptidylprolyl isomerase [Sorangium sp. So ce542]|uniref:peptidylprolyl isomerase n=1 Tax=Sorangium sp. So ce542 TaxID=3133316 RepID=UPI003F621687